MSVLLQVSDPHFGTEIPAVVEALVQLARAQAPQVLVLSGDVTQRARRSQFAQARRFVDRLAIAQTLVIPGNHDIPLFNLLARAFWPYSGFQREFGDELEPTLETPELLLLCLNTTRRQRHIDGELSAGQIQRVARRLRAASPQQLRLVVTHQPLHVSHPEDAHDLIHGHEAAVRAWSAAGADIVMGGHIHLPFVRQIQERFPDLPRRLWCAQAGTATSHRVRPDAPNSVHILRYGVAAAAGCGVVERWDYDSQRASFERLEVHHLVLDRGAGA